MPALARQRLIVAGLAGKAFAQRAQLNDAVRSLRASRGMRVAVATVVIAAAAARARPLFVALYGLTFGKPLHRRQHIRALLRWVLARKQK
ncbi:MAG: hypothetical protein JJT96_00740 [Opitutales bacterium]|nr:hypothetical protein [Opitutales bacterium]